MHLRRLSIQNFRAIRTKELAFDDAMGRIRPVTVLAGPNGCGKTSVLIAIYRTLAGAMGYKSEDVPPPSEDEVFREDGPGGWSSERARTLVKVELEYVKAELDALPDVLKHTRQWQNRVMASKQLEARSLPQNRLVVEWQFPPGADQYGGERSPFYVRTYDIHQRPVIKGTNIFLRAPWYAIKAWTQPPRPAIDRKLLDSMGILRIFAQNRGKRWVAAEDAEAFAFEPEEGFDPMAEDTRPRTRRANLPGILKRLHEAAQGQRENANGHAEDWEDQVRQLFRKICSPKEYVGWRYPSDPNATGAPLLKDGDRRYPLSMAATGEQVILDYLTQFVYPRPVNNSLILIDEPELHLHPRWVRQLYRALPHMGRDNQFIMTTHSPELRQLAAEDNALIDLGESLGSAPHA